MKKHRGRQLGILPKRTSKYWTVHNRSPVVVDSEPFSDVIPELEEDKCYSPRDEELYDPWPGELDA